MTLALTTNDDIGATRPLPKKAKGRLDVICDGLGIRLVPVWRTRRPGCSHARGMMKAIRAEHGDGHLILTLRCIRESRPNREALRSETIGAVSDVLLSRPDWQERPSDVFDALDSINLHEMRDRALRRRPWPVRETMRVMLYRAMLPGMDGQDRSTVR